MPDLMLAIWVVACVAFAATACVTEDPMCDRIRGGMTVIERGRRRHEIPFDEARDQMEVQREALKQQGCIPSDGPDRHESPAEDHMIE